MDRDLVPIILCGGAGSRLWPLSVPSFPKPFHHFFGDGSLFQQTLRRAIIPPFSKKPLVIALARNADLAYAQARDSGIAIDLVLEPDGRDTCLAVLTGVLMAQKLHGSVSVMVLAADHAIPDHHEFARTLAAASAAEEGRSIILFGIAPHEPRTGLGYIIPGGIAQFGELAAVQRFVEKPDREQAAALIAKGALWNSGNFLGASETFLQEAARHAPDHLAGAEKAVAAARTDGALTTLQAYGREIVPLSLDRAIVEKSDRCCVMPSSYAWSDLGTWDDVQRLAASGRAFVHAPGQTVHLIGVDDLIVVSTAEGLLVTRPGYSNDLKVVRAGEAK